MLFETPDPLSIPVIAVQPAREGFNRLNKRPGGAAQILAKLEGPQMLGLEHGGLRGKIHGKTDNLQPLRNLSSAVVFAALPAPGPPAPYLVGQPIETAAIV